MNFSKKRLLARKTLWRGLAGCLMALTLMSCSTTPEKKLQKDGLTLYYQEKSSAGSEVEKLSLNHPTKISQQEIINHLLSLRFEESTLLGKKKYVYSQQDVKDISRLLTKAINRASPQNIIHFSVKSSHGTTEGDFFVSGNKINWRFSIVQGQEFSNNSFPGYRAATWRLLPKPGQGYHVSPKLLGSRTQENWIIAELVLPERARRLKKQDATPPAAIPTSPQKNPTHDKADLEKKLEALKKFHEKGLIDDQDYERKKQELLDGLL